MALLHDQHAIPRTSPSLCRCSTESLMRFGGCSHIGHTPPCTARTDAYSASVIPYRVRSRMSRAVGFLTPAP
jgi:hypothetical protein